MSQCVLCARACVFVYVVVVMVMLLLVAVLAGSSSFDRNQPSLPTPFILLLASVSVLTALSTVFHFLNFRSALLSWWLTGLKTSTN